MQDLEQLSNLEHLDELSQEAIENMGEILPIENTQEMMPETDRPKIQEVKNKDNISFSGGNCICSCDLTCTRA